MIAGEGDSVDCPSTICNPSPPVVTAPRWRWFGRAPLLALDADFLHDFLITAAGIEVNEETLALDMVKQVGPRGNYLMEQHTLKHMRQIPFSELMLETGKRGRTGADAEIETARETAIWIIENHKPDPLDDTVQRELERIIAAADREIKGA